ncbi:hypothetical protein ACIBG8_33985 [Nonomuraea sp. NPDC050556]|uniref:hypothetical protein n=1 Tax=Nonomuraea sp. NPDC050556 TaxID=3364369 RepID=UPI0037B2D92E
MRGAREHRDGRHQPEGGRVEVAELLVGAGEVVEVGDLAQRRSRVMPRWSGIPLAVCFLLFIPQFFGPPAFRIGHGVLAAAGGIWLAWALWRSRRF